MIDILSSTNIVSIDTNSTSKYPYYKIDAILDNNHANNTRREHSSAQTSLPKEEEASAINTI